MTKKSKKQTKKQQPSRVSERKRMQREKRLAPVVEAIAEPTPEQIGKVEAEELESAKVQYEAEKAATENILAKEILEADATMNIESFDPKMVIAKYLKKNGA